MRTIFSISLLFKLSAEADTAIQAVAYLIWDQSDEETSIIMTNKIINKIANGVINLITKLNNSVAATKSFLDSTSQQQASKLVSLRTQLSINLTLLNPLQIPWRKSTLCLTPGDL